MDIVQYKWNTCPITSKQKRM